MGRKKNKKTKIISSVYKKNDFNDYIEGFTDEEDTDIRKNDDNRNFEYTMRIFPNPDW